jgi:hypothetical protein
MRRAALADGQRDSSLDGAAGLAAGLAQRGLAAREFIRGGQPYVHAAVPGAPSAGLDVQCQRRGVSWCYVTEWGHPLDSTDEAVQHIAWLFGARR